MLLTRELAVGTLRPGGLVMKVFTHDEVAFVFGVSRTTVYNWQNAELLPDVLNAEAVKQMIAMRQEEVNEMQAKVDRARQRLQILIDEEPLS